MEPHTKITYPCEFCGEKTLQVLTWPGHTEIKSSRRAVAKSKTIRKISEGFELTSERCSNCGKTASEIKLAGKEGIKELDQDKRRKRLEELKKLGFAGVVNG